MKKLISIGNAVHCEHINTHSHNVWEMIYYTEGKVKLMVHEKEYELSEGVFVCQPPFLSHSEEGSKIFSNYFFSVENYDLLPNKLIIIEDTSSKVLKQIIQQMQ